MNKVGEFEKVSCDQFLAAMKEEFYEGVALSEDAKDDLRTLWEAIKLPTRATVGSAGYDFKAPFDFRLAAGQQVKIPTGIRVKIEPGWWLGCFPRSGLGFKYRIGLANTCGVIDADYYASDNEGHIFAKLVNNGDKDVVIWSGDGFLQGIFLPYGITYSDEADGVRNGGMGSTDVK